MLAALFRGRAKSCAGPLKVLASCPLCPSLAVACSRPRPRRGSHLNFNSPRAAGTKAPQAAATALHSSDALPQAPHARFPVLKATSDKIKTKQNAHSPPKTVGPTPIRRLAPCLSPLHLLAGLRSPSPAHARPARRKRLPVRPKARRSRATGPRPQILEVKEQPQKSARAAGEGAAPSEPPSPFTGELLPLLRGPLLGILSSLP